MLLLLHVVSLQLIKKKKICYWVEIVCKKIFQNKYSMITLNIKRLSKELLKSSWNNNIYTHIN